MDSHVWTLRSDAHDAVERAHVLTMSKIIALNFDLGAPVFEPIHGVDPERLLGEAVASGAASLQIDWAGMFRCNLPVEDDVMFIAMEYLELDAFLLTSGVKRSFVLGGGLLEIVSSVTGDRVEMLASLFPHLDIRFVQYKAAVTNVSRYRNAWVSMMRDLIAQLPSHLFRA